jgi:hypothetical protein
MRENTVLAPQWLREEFARRGGGEPFLIRHVSCQVWGDGKSLVAKIHPPNLLGRRQAAAERTAAMVVYDTSVPTAVCLETASAGGVELGDEGNSISWWEWVRITGLGDPHDNARMVRQLHDSFDVNPGVPYMSPNDIPSLTPIGVDPEAVELAARLAKYRDDAVSVWEKLFVLPKAVVHGDANPTNLVKSNFGPLMLDYGCTQWAPRVLDVATIAVLAVETGEGSLASVLATYLGGEELPGVSEQEVRLAARLEHYRRAWSCVRHPEWLQEGWQRLYALEADEWFVFSPGEGPK